MLFGEFSSNLRAKYISVFRDCISLSNRPRQVINKVNGGRFLAQDHQLLEPKEI